MMFSVVVASAFDGDVVVAVVELDIFDEQVAAVFGVDAVIVYQLGIVADTPADDVFRFQQVNAPEWGVGDEHPFDGDVLAVEELYQLRTQIETLAEVPFLDRCLVVIHVAGQLLSFPLLVLPGREGRCRVAVYRSFPYDGDIFELVSVDERAVILQESPFPACFYHGEVVTGLGREFQRGALLQFEAHVAHKMYGPVEQVFPGRYDDAGSALPGGAFHGFVKGRLAVFLAIAFGAKGRDA